MAAARDQTPPSVAAAETHALPNLSKQASERQLRWLWRAQLWLVSRSWLRTRMKPRPRPKRTAAPETAEAGVGEVALAGRRLVLL